MMQLTVNLLEGVWIWKTREDTPRGYFQVIAKTILEYRNVIYGFKLLIKRVNILCIVQFS